MITEMKRWIAVWLAFLTIMGGMMDAVNVSRNANAVSNKTQALPSSRSKLYRLHDPIYINGNDNFTYANGVTSGNGTQEKPYIIENWEIDLSNPRVGAGIIIMNTDAYFVIRNCLLYNGWRGYWKESNHGILFYFVQNGAIENITSYDNYYGLWLDSSSNNRIANCVVYNNKRGIYLDEAKHSQITSCNVYNNLFEGISLYSSSNTSITDCTFYNNEQGVYLSWNSDNNRITNCCVYNNSQKGIELRFSLNNRIEKCYCYNNCEYGISFVASPNNTIINCTISNSDRGVYLHSSSNNNITNSAIYNNSNGIYLHSSSNNNTICYNQFIDNCEHFRDEGSNYWYDNEFIKLGKAGEKSWLSWLRENRVLIAFLIVLIFIALALTKIGITSARKVERLRGFYPDQLKCVYCQETTKITSRERPLLFQCPKCGGKSVMK
ncbi:MAG: NosD domain-containing protein [Candidatus Thermoplasmatota archaeon]